MKHTLSVFLLLLTTCGSLFAEDKQARIIKYSNKDIIELRCQMRISTAIVLPANEQILDFTTGDKEHWIVNGAQNFCYIHPAKEGAVSNLNLICSSGNIYSFVLAEVSGDNIDYKVFVEPRDESLITALASPNPRFVPAEEMAHYKAQVTSLAGADRQDPNGCRQDDREGNQSVQIQISLLSQVPVPVQEPGTIPGDGHLP